MKSSNQIQIQQNQQISTVTSLSAKDDLKLHERKGFDPEELIQQMAQVTQVTQDPMETGTSRTSTPVIKDLFLASQPGPNPPPFWSGLGLKR